MYEKKRKDHMGRHTLFMCVLFLMALAAIIMSAIVLKRSMDEDSESPAADQQKPNQQKGVQTTSTLPSSKTTTPVMDTRTDAVVDCHPKNYADRQTPSRQECERRGCQWQTPGNTREPRCIYRRDVGYELDGQVVQNGSVYTATLRRKGLTTVYGMDVYDKVSVTVDMYYQKGLRIYLKPVTSSPHWEIPDEALKITRPSSTGLDDYRVEFVNDPVFGIIVRRKSTDAVIFNTAVPGLTFTQQFLQVTTKLPSDNVYGFGEHNHRRFRHDMNWKTWPIFTRDMAPVDEWNLYGAHPVHMVLEDDGNASMVFLKNSHAMDVSLQPSPYPAITYRVIGGVFDFYVFTGPSPQEAVQQYLEAVGRPPMPPYWALGFHLCRYGYKNLTDMKQTYKRNYIDAQIPQDVQWGDIDYMYKKYMFTVDKGTFKELPEFVDELHKEGQKFVVILDPGIGSNQTLIQEAKANSPGYEVYEDAVFKGVLVRNPNGTGPLVGRVWPGMTVYPDFSDTGAPAFWQTWIQYFIDKERIKVDGLWIDMNEPSSFVPGSVDGCEYNKWNNPPYVPPIVDGDKFNGSLYYKTICMDARQSWGLHYEVHSLYGHGDAMATRTALLNIHPGKRPFVMTRSSFAGTGKYSFKWLGDNGSRWPHMHWSIVGLLEFSMFGFAMNGADICGFWDPAEYEMCLRWFQLGAFYPFSRSHNINEQPDQDPAVWGEEFVMTVRHALLVRYKLLPYYYTVFKDASVYGKTVTRPLMFEFPEDKGTWDIDRQFLIGANFLVSPVLEKGKRTVDAYFPKGRWYSFYDGKEVSYEESGKTVTLPAPLPVINIHSRGGSIIPVQEPANNTKNSRLNPMGLWVSLDEIGSAYGELYMDDGESLDSYEKGEYLEIQFNVSKGEAMDIRVVHSGYTPPGNLTFAIIEFYGLPSYPATVSVDGVRLEARHIRGKGYIVQLIDIKLDIMKNHTVRWTVF